MLSVGLAIVLGLIAWCCAAAGTADEPSVMDLPFEHPDHPESRIPW